MKKVFPKLVKNCGRVRSIKDVLVVKSYGVVELSESNGTEVSWFRPIRFISRKSV